MTNAASQPPAQRDLAGVLFKVAWMSVVLGIAIELLIIAGMFFFNTLSQNSAKPIVAETAQKVSWSFLVCTGISVGTAAQRAKPGVMSALGTIFAPLAFVVARAIHKGASSALGIDFPVGPGPGIETIAIIKAIQYGTFGGILAWVSRRSWGERLPVFIGVGLLAGVVFGGLVLYLAFGQMEHPEPAKVFSRAINEVLFPVGCAIVLWSATAIGKASAKSQ